MLSFDFKKVYCNTGDDMLLICHFTDGCSDNGYVVWSGEECCDFGPGLAVKVYSEEGEECISCTK